MSIAYSKLAKQDEEQVNVIQIFTSENLQSLPLFVPWISILDGPAPSGVALEDIPLYTPDKKIVLLSSPDRAPFAFSHTAPEFDGLVDITPTHATSSVHLGDFVARLAGQIGTEHYYHDFFTAYALADAIDALEIRWPDNYRSAFEILISHLSASRPLGEFPHEDTEVVDAVHWSVGALACNYIYL